MLFEVLNAIIVINISWKYYYIYICVNRFFYQLSHLVGVEEEPVVEQGQLCVACSDLDEKIQW